MTASDSPEGLPAVGRVLNAAGTFTPLGVSRSSPAVAGAAAWALQRFLVIDELQDLASRELAAFGGAEAGTVVHCAAAGITLGVAAAMAGADPERIAQLPDSTGLRRVVVVPAPHLIDYGHPLATDVRLAGATVQACGQPHRCSADELLPALAAPEVACLLLVSSRLTRDPAFDFAAACEAARAAGVPVLIDGAAQDLRVRDLLALRPAAVVLSAQKYLAAPTAGLLLGEAGFIAAVRAQQKGIGRAMKPSKEAIVGVLAALNERRRLDLGAWGMEQARKAQAAADALRGLPQTDVSLVPDPLGAPFARVRLRFAGGAPEARRVAQALRRHEPPVWVMEHGLADGVLSLELVALRGDEVDAVVRALIGAVNADAAR